MIFFQNENPYEVPSQAAWMSSPTQDGYPAFYVPNSVTSFQVPDLSARWDYERENLAADLGLAGGDPGLDQAAEAFLGAARQEFWLEAARLARRHLAPAAAGETARDHAG